MTDLRRCTALVAAFLALCPLVHASLAFTPSAPRAGDAVTFTVVPSSVPRPADGYTWAFGDGTTLNTTVAQTTVAHAYAAAGVYSASVSYYYQPAVGGPLIPLTDRATVTVAPAIPKVVSFTPLLPSTCETVTFQATGYTQSALRWEFGDGTVVTAGTAVQTHAYLAVGTYVVRVYDGGTGAASATATVSVTNRRTISVSPFPVKTGTVLLFQTVGFVSTCLKWDFGDGTVVANGGPTASHAYRNPGPYVVSAVDDCGRAACAATLAVSVTASQGPLAPFSLSNAFLRWSNGTTDIQVPKDAAGLMAFAELKYEGTGLLQAEWRVDGRPVKAEAGALVFAGRTTLDSGRVPSLPTSVPGRHVVTFEILRPGVSFTIPAITYFVSAEPEGARAAASRIENSIAPIVRRIEPATVERGKEYRLRIEGLRFAPSTVVTLAGIGVTALRFESSETIWIDVFVPPTARDGGRPAVAADERGANVGPAILSVAKSQR